MSPQNRNTQIIWIITALILASLACGSIQFGVVTPTAVEESTPSDEALQTNMEEITQPNTPRQTEEVSTPIAAETPPEPSSTVAVIAWLGNIVSLHEDSQYDDLVILYPPGTGEFGLTGITSEVEAEIRTLRDAQGPNDYVHLWGELHCNVEDYNNCQLVVEKLQYGPNYSEEEITNWVGTIKVSNSNVQSGLSYVFELSGDYPMWYSIYASQDPELQTQIESLRDTGAVVKVDGKLLVGIPDINGTRIEIASLEVVTPGTEEQPEVEKSFDPTTDWPVFINQRYGYQFKYPAEATISLFGPQGFSTDEKPADMTADEYMDSLLKEYTNQLCVQIEYSLGWIYIAAPPNKERYLTPCGPTGLGAGEIIDKVETITVGDQLFQASGVEFKLQLTDSAGNPITGETLDLHGEMFGFELEDGTRIRFGSTPRQDATYDDYLMKTKEMLLQIIATYEKQP